MNIKEIDGLDELLAEIYETLKRHERMLTPPSVSAMALTKVLHQTPWFAAAYAQAFADAEKSIEEQGSSLQLRLLDEIIERLRRSD